MKNYKNRYEIKARKAGAKVETFIIEYDPWREPQAVDSFTLTKVLEGFEILSSTFLDQTEVK